MLLFFFSLFIHLFIYLFIYFIFFFFLGGGGGGVVSVSNFTEKAIYIFSWNFQDSSDMFQGKRIIGSILG